MSARSGAIKADTAAHPAMAVLCKGDVGKCPSYSTRLAAGPDAVWLALVVEARWDPSRGRNDARAARSSDGRVALLLLLLRVIVAAVSRETCELRVGPAGEHREMFKVVQDLEIRNMKIYTWYTL